MSERPIQGKSMRITRLDAQGNPTGESIKISGASIDWSSDLPDASPSEALTEDLTFKTYTADFTFIDVDPEFMAMGAERMFDYAQDMVPSEFGGSPVQSEYKQRLTRCYELAALAFVTATRVSPEDYARHDLPFPETLVHGWWSSPETRQAPIAHAWMVLSDGRIWEPISSLIFDAEAFAEFTQPFDQVTYTLREAIANMVRYDHYGRWD